MPILDGIKRHFRKREETRAVFDKLRETLNERIANSADARLAAEFAPGTVVRLKSGGPEMTVKTSSWANPWATGVSTTYPNGFAQVSWFHEDGHMETGAFGAEELDIVAAEPPTDEEIDALIVSARKWKNHDGANVIPKLTFPANVEVVYRDGNTQKWRLSDPREVAAPQPSWSDVVAWRYA